MIFFQFGLYPHAIDKEAPNEITQLHDHRQITKIVEVIGLICDGQHRELQNCLREQKCSINSINVVEELVDFLTEYTRHTKQHYFTLDIIRLLTEVFQTLIELCSGNYENTKTIFEKQIVSIINYYLHLDIIDKITDTYTNHVLKLKETVVGLLEIMLEETSSNAAKLVHNIASGLDIKALLFSMSEFYVLKDEDCVKKELVDDNARRALFKTYSILKHLTDFEVFGKSTP